MSVTSVKHVHESKFQAGKAFQLNKMDLFLPNQYRLRYELLSNVGTSHLNRGKWTEVGGRVSGSPNVGITFVQDLIELCCSIHVLVDFLQVLITIRIL
jgi:hypothetical protein